MTGEAQTLGFGVTYDMVAARTACGRLLTLTSHRSDDAIPPHKHANDYLCIVLAGGFAEQEGSRWRERTSGCFFRHHAGETHHDRFGPRGAVCVNLHFPAGEPGPGLEGVCAAPTRVMAQQLAFELAASSREELALASLAAAIMGDVQPRTTPQRDRGPWLDRIVAAIADQPERRWTLGELAELAGRHPVHVAQAFQARTGHTLGAFQRLRRLTSLSVALRHGNSPLAALAADFGYCDQSHMTSEFRAAFGVTPGRYRRDFH
ncbi:MAG TPA: AraC family transcriptional regulator [Sphingomicrobium sp.]